MLRVLNNLLKIQSLITILFFAIIFILKPLKEFYLAALCGGLINLLASLVLLRFWRKLPVVINNQLFYKLLIISLVIKYLVIFLFLIILITQTNFSPSMILVSFFINYLLSYWIVLCIK